MSRRGPILGYFLCLLMFLSLFVNTGEQAHAIDDNKTIGVVNREPVPCGLRSNTKALVRQNLGPEGGVWLYTETYRTKIWWYDCANSHPVRTVKVSYKITGPHKEDHCGFGGDLVKNYRFNPANLDNWNPGWTTRFPCRSRIYYGSMTYHPRGVSIGPRNDRCLSVHVHKTVGAPLIPLRDFHGTIPNVCIPRP